MQLDEVSLRGLLHERVHHAIEVPIYPTVVKWKGAPMAGFGLQAQAAVVVFVFESVLEGKGLTEIAKEVNSRGVASPRSKGWSKTGLHAILTNEVYTGTHVWGRNSKRKLPPIRVENAFPAIVTRDVFDRVQSTLKERAPARIHPRRATSRFLLSGLTRCGHCGKALVGQDAKGGQFSYYICGTLNKKGAGSCPAPYLNAARFEGTVIGRIKEHILTPDNLTELAALVNEELDSASSAAAGETDLLDGELADAASRLGRLYDAIETGDIAVADLTPRIRELTDRQDRLRTREAEVMDSLTENRIELVDAAAVSRYVDDLHALLNESALPERRAFIRGFVQQVQVTGREVLLTYTWPLAAGRESEAVGVLPMVHRGGRYWT